MTRAEQARFGDVLLGLLGEAGYVTRLGAPDLIGFAREKGLNYEQIRKAVVGDRNPHYGLMERVAAALDVDPDVFAEYRLREFDPKVVGLEKALENLGAWTQSRKRRRR